MKKVNICFLTDNGYAMPTGVAIESLCKNKKKNTKYDIYILAIDISYENEKILESMNSNNISINIIKLKNKYKDFNMKNVSATSAAMYKFQIPDILSSQDKVIYLDGDIIVKSDLSELYSIDLGDNYIGAVLDINGVLKHHYNMYIKHNVFYFNSGVMLMNLKKMRKEKISEKLIEYRLNGYNELMDQDALNYILKGRTLEIPFKYNTQTMYTIINKDIKQLKKVLKLPEKYEKCDDIINNSIILHYSLKGKPWKNNNTFMYDEWNYYYNISPYKDKIKIKLDNNIIKKKNLCQKVSNLIKNYRRYRFLRNFIEARK